MADNKKRKKIPEFDRGYHRGMKEGINLGCDTVITILLLVLADRHGFDKFAVKQVYEEIMKYAEMVREHYFKFDDMKKILLEEYNVSVHWVDGDIQG